MKKIYIFTLFALFFIVGCENKTEDPEQASFLEQTKIGLYKGGNIVFEFDDNLQKAFNLDGTMLRYQNDDQSKYFNIAYIDKPAVNLGQNVKTKISCLGISFEPGEYTFEIKRRNASYTWYWHPESGYGFIITNVN